MNHLEIKSIAGVAAIQTLLKRAGGVIKSPPMLDCKIDGQVGPLTYAALNDLLAEIYRARPIIPQGTYGLADGVLALQRWYETMRTLISPRAAQVLPSIECDGIWGGETYAAFCLLIALYGEVALNHNLGNKSGMIAGKLTPRFPIKKDYQEPPFPKAKTHGRCITQLTEGMNDKNTMDVLAGAMGWDNAVIPPAQFLATDYEAIVSKSLDVDHVYGMLAYLPPDRSKGRYTFEVVGLYVPQHLRGLGIGTELVSHLKAKARAKDVNVAMKWNTAHAGLKDVLQLMLNNNIVVIK